MLQKQICILLTVHEQRRKENMIFSLAKYHNLVISVFYGFSSAIDNTGFYKFIFFEISEWMTIATRVSFKEFKTSQPFLLSLFYFRNVSYTPVDGSPSSFLIREKEAKVWKRQWPVGRGERISGETGEGFAGTIIKNTWTITRGVETEEGSGGGLGWWGGVGGR